MPLRWRNYSYSLCETVPHTEGHLGFLGPTYDMPVIPTFIMVTIKTPPAPHFQMFLLGDGSVTPCWELLCFFIMENNFI